MEALLPVLIPALISAGVQLAPLLEGLLATRSQLQSADPARLDVNDATMTAVETAIQIIQDKINAAAAGGAMS